MSELKICRICLRTECKVYNYDRYQLKPYYEEVMALKVNEKDGLPHYFCFECATMLHKFHKFKEKCYMGQKTLKEISWRGGHVTYEAVYKIDRGLRHLKSPLDILTVTKRVKTYCTKDSSKLDQSDIESVHEEEKDVLAETDVNYISDDAMTDRDDLKADDDPVNQNPELETDDLKNDEEPVDVKVDIDMKKPKQVKEVVSKSDDVDDVDDDPKSPKTVFVDVKKDIITLKSEKIKERRKSFSEYGLKKINPAFAKKRTKFLDTTNWKKFNLTEEEAIREFRAKSGEAKYVAAAFKCVDCFKGFSKEEMLKRHQQLRHSVTLGALECRFCHMRFKWDCHLRKHMRQHFTKYMCLRCNLVCSLENTVTLHDDYHNGVVKKCIHCDEEFLHTSTYYTHLRTHRSDYVCTLCGASFVSPLGLHMHKKVKHVNNDIESPDDDDEVNTFCEKCNIRFETRKAYEEHLFHSAMHIDGVEDEKINEYCIPRKVLGKKMQAKITYELKSMKPLEEGIAPERKRRRGTKLKRKHRKPTTCHQCGKHFDTQAACMKHHLTDHPRTSFCPANERHICEICGASLAPGSVATHQNMHTREKLHPCEICGRAFHNSVGLKRHSVTHTGEKPFPCSLCDKRFTQSNSMKLHYRTFHLKQPYPKRNRRKKKEDPPETSERQGKSSASEEESDDSLPEPDMNSTPSSERRIEPVTNALPERPEENMHYLTLG